MEMPSTPSTKDRISRLALEVKNHVRPLGLLQMGLPCPLTGSGMAFPWNALAHAPLATGNLVEDLRLGIDLTIAGYPPLFEPESHITGLMENAESESKVQRKRWEHGHIHTMMTQAPALAFSALRLRKPSLLASAFDLLIPPIALLVTTLALVGVLAMVVSSRAVGIVGISFACVALGTLLSWLRYGREIIELKTLLAAPFYVFGKIPMYLRFFTGRQKQWIRSTRDALPSELDQDPRGGYRIDEASGPSIKEPANKSTTAQKERVDRPR